MIDHCHDLKNSYILNVCTFVLGCHNQCLARIALCNTSNTFLKCSALLCTKIGLGSRKGEHIFLQFLLRPQREVGSLTLIQVRIHQTLAKLQLCWLRVDLSIPLKARMCSHAWPYHCLFSAIEELLSNSLPSGFGASFCSRECSCFCTLPLVIPILQTEEKALGAPASSSSHFSLP